MDGADLIKVEFDLIYSELKRGKKETGRPSTFDIETYKRFIYYYLQTGMKVWSALKSGMTKSTYDRIVQGSETFRSVLERDGEDLKAQAMINVSKAIRGVAPFTDAEGRKHEGIPGSVKDSWAYLQLKAEEKKKEEETPPPSIGAPRNEKEAELMLMLMNKHSDYVESKRKQSDRRS